MSLAMKWGFIPFPLAIVDDARHRNLTLGEYRLLGYLLRHRFRVKSEAIRVTQDELLNGLRRPDGQRWDVGCGITSGRDLRKARAALEVRGWLRVHVQTDGAMLYELCLSEDEEDGQGGGPGARGDSGDSGAKCTQPAPGAKRTRKQDKMHPLLGQNAPAYKEEKVKKVKEVVPSPPPESVAVAEASQRQVSPDDAPAGQASQKPAYDAKGEQQQQPQKQPQGPQQGREAALTLVGGRDLRLVSPKAAEGHGKGDPRHSQCRDACRRYAEYKRVAVVWSGREAGALSKLLKTAPGLTVEQFTDCLRNRARSEGVSHGEQPGIWIRTLLKFQDGPHDRFGKVMEVRNGASANGAGGSSAAVRRQSESLSEIERACVERGWAAPRGDDGENAGSLLESAVGFGGGDGTSGGMGAADGTAWLASLQ